MFDLLTFPEQFRANKRIDKQKFLKAANLTQKERETLAQSVVQVTVQYALQFRDGSELLILLVEIDRWLRKYELFEIARVIASSFPYRCLITLQQGNSARIVWQETRANKTNSNRSVSEKMRGTRLFDYTKCVAGDPESNLIAALLKEAAYRDTARGLIFGWEGCFDRYQRDKTAQKAAWMHRFSESMLTAERYKQWLNASESEALARSAPADGYQTLFYETCCEYCYPLFCEFFGEFDVDDDEFLAEWLLAYVAACDDIADEDHKGSLRPIDVRRIRSAFENKREPEDDMPLFDIDELRDRLTAMIVIEDISEEEEE